MATPAKSINLTPLRAPYPYFLMNFNHYFIVLVFAASFISSTTINNFHALASGEMLEYAMTACKTLNFDNFMKCMKDHNILNLELIKKAWTAKDNESINYDQIFGFPQKFSFVFKVE